MGNTCCDTKGSEPDRLRLQTLSTLTALVGVLLAWILPRLGLPGAVVPALTVSYVAGGWSAAIGAWAELRRGKLDVDALMLLAALGAASVGHGLEGGILLFLFSLGHTLEAFAFRRTRRSIESLVQLRPESATRVVDDREEVVPVEQLRPGDVVRVRPGDRIPIDGEVIGGASSVDESTLTGEAMPIGKEIGASVFAGTLSADGYLDILMTRAADDTALARIVELVEQAHEARAPTQSFIERVEGRYAVGVIVAAAATVLIPWLLLDWAFQDAFYRAMTLLVVASPCALVISIPATIVSAVSNGARHGVLFKGGAHLDALADVRTFAMDKTGTVTVGRPVVVDVRVAAGLPAGVPAGGSGAVREPDVPDTNRLLRLAASAEARSEHHLAAAIVACAAEREIVLTEPTSFMSTPGQGISAIVDGHRIDIGRRSWVESRTSSADPGFVRRLERDHPTATQVHAAIDGSYAGAFAIRDDPRASATEAIRSLESAGISRIVMLTGDAEATARAVANDVGIREVHAGLKPAEKSRIIEGLRADGGVAMVGDGVNDAPALAVADVGIAIGAAGTDVALETADIVVMGEDLGALAYAVTLSRRTRRIVRQNLVIAVGMMGLLVSAALMGWIGLTAGVIGHEGSTVLVVFNGLRLLADGR